VYCLQQLCSALRQYRNGLSAALRLLTELRANQRFATFVQVNHESRAFAPAPTVQPARLLKAGTASYMFCFCFLFISVIYFIY